MEGFKVCSKCGGEPQPLDQFRKASGLPNGHRPECKACSKEVERFWRAKNQEKLKEYNSNYQETNKVILKIKDAEYYVKNKVTIKEKVSAYNKAHPEDTKKRHDKFKLLHPERYAEQKKNWERNNPDKIKAIYKSRYSKYGEIIRARNIIWRKKNKVKCNGYYHNYNARKTGNGGIHNLQEWLTLKKKYGYACLRCGKKESEIKLTKDHVLPVKWGGGNSISNLQPLCLHCNQSKNGKYADYRPDSKTYGEGWERPSLWN